MHTTIATYRLVIQAVGGIPQFLGSGDSRVYHYDNEGLAFLVLGVGETVFAGNEMLFGRHFW